ncbi:MAG: hypothetical protein ACOZF0_06270 [Thermodesulfobacteriota bacterium]
MNTLYLSVAGCFLLGSGGYVLFHFWLRPIWRYRSIKHQVVRDIAAYLNSISDEIEGVFVSTSANEKIAAIRHHAAALTDCYREALPDWYRVLLNSRGESPEDAAKHLFGLSNTRNYEHARSRVGKIRHTLKIG